MCSAEAKECGSSAHWQYLGNKGMPQTNGAGRGSGLSRLSYLQKEGPLSGPSR